MAEINPGNYEQRIRELRTETQKFQSQDAKDIVNGVITLLQTAWNIEQHATNPTAMRGTTTEQRSNR